jgi:hypothetical protein
MDRDDDLEPRVIAVNVALQGLVTLSFALVCFVVLFAAIPA